MEQLSALRGDRRLNDAGSTGNVIAKATRYGNKCVSKEF